MYNQHDRSCSVFYVVFLTFVGFHISFDLVVVVGNSSGGVVFAVVGASVVCLGAGVGVGCYVFDIIFLAVCFALFGSLRATYRVKISSSVSSISSNIVPRVLLVAVMVCVATVGISYVILPLTSAVRFTFSYFITATHSDAPSKSSKFFTLRLTPST
jgi:hypothetical protein